MRKEKKSNIYIYIYIYIYILISIMKTQGVGKLQYFPHPTPLVYC